MTGYHRVQVLHCQQWTTIIFSPETNYYSGTCEKCGKVLSIPKEWIR